ncbi:MAG: T9SS type A sorting domain-containing protein [Candidatus Muiribacteriota bacterium]
MNKFYLKKPFLILLYCLIIVISVCANPEVVHPIQGTQVENAYVKVEWNHGSDLPDAYKIKAWVVGIPEETIEGEVPGNVNYRWVGPLGNAAFEWELYAIVDGVEVPITEDPIGFSIDAPEGYIWDVEDGNAFYSEFVNKTSPLDAADIEDTQPQFQWQQSASFDNYRIILSNNSEFLDDDETGLSDGNFVLRAETTSDNHTFDTVLAEEHLYYWRVLGLSDGCFNPATAEVNTFTVGYPEGVVILTLPQNGDTLNDSEVTFGWEQLEPAPDTYEIQISSNDTFTNIVHQESLILQETTYTVPYGVLSFDSTYYWRVYPDYEGDEPQPEEATVWNFSLQHEIDDPPPPVVLDSPNHGVTFESAQITFSWHPLSPEPDKYYFEIANDEFFSSPIAHGPVELGNTETDYTTPTESLEMGETYYWRVYAELNGLSEPDAADSRSFHLESDVEIPPEVTLISPSNTAVINSESVDFTWEYQDPNPDKYILQISTNDSFLGGIIYDEELEGYTTSFSADAGLSYDNTYYWRVYGINYDGENELSNPEGADIREFSLEEDPDADTPGKVNLVSPLNGAVLNTEIVEFYWQQLDEIPDNYVFELAQDSGFTSSQEFTVGGNTTNYTVSSGLSFNNTYYWRVYGIKNDASNPEGATIRSFSLEEDESEAPPPVTLVNPGHDALLNEDEVTFLWEKLIPYPDSYIIQVSTSSNITGGIVFENTLDGSTSSQHVSSELSFGNTYYWRVYGVKDGYSNPGEAIIRSFNIDYAEGDVPSPVNLLQPENEAMLSSTAIEFSWEGLSPAPDNYVLQVSEDSHFSTLFYNQELSGIETVQSVSGLVEGNTYYWRVYGKNAENYNDGAAEIRMFSIIDDSGGVEAPSPVTLISPEDGAIINQTEINFLWQALDEEVDNYILQIAASNDFQNDLIENEILSSESTSYFLSGGISFNNTYYWRVYGVKSSQSDSASAQVRNFSVEELDEHTPPPVALIDPVNDEIIHTDAVSFSWEALSPHPDDYVIQISSSGDFLTDLIYNEELTVETSHNISGIFQPGETYYWRVYGKNAENYNDGAAEIRSFTLHEDVQPGVPLPVTLISPEDDENLSTTNVEFSWEGLEVEPDTYTIQISMDNSFSTPVEYHQELLGHATSHTVSDILSDDEIYYWRVYGERDDLSAPKEAEIRSFYIESGSTGDDPAPSGVTLISPSDGLQTTDQTPAFTWYKLEDSPDYYKIEISSNSSFANIIEEATVEANISEYSLTSSLDTGNTYYWRVYGVAGTSSAPEEADIWSFSIAEHDGTNPLPVTLISPENAEDLVSTSAVFNWEELDLTPDYYVLEIADDSAFNSIKYTNSTTDNSYILSDGILELDSIYYWRIYAVEDENSNSDEAEVRYLYTGKTAPDRVLTEAIYEVVPSTALADTRTEISIYTKANIDESYDSGFDIIKIDKTDLSQVYIEEAAMYVGEEEYTRRSNPTGKQFEIEENGNILEVKVGEVLGSAMSEEIIEIKIEGEISGEAGEERIITAGYEHSGYEIEAEAGRISPGNGDGIEENTNSNYIKIGNVIEEVRAEIVPTKAGVDTEVKSSMYIRIESGADSIGVDQIEITVPSEFEGIKAESMKAWVDYEDVTEASEFEINGQQILINFEQIYIGNREIKIEKRIKTPNSTVSQEFEVYANNRGSNAGKKAEAGNIIEGEGEGSLNLETGQIVNSGYGQINPYMVSGGEEREYELQIKPVIEEGNFGINQIRIETGEHLKQTEYKKLEIDGEELVIVSAEYPSNAGEASINEREGEEGKYIEINFGKTYDKEYSEKIIKYTNNMETADISSEGEEIKVYLQNREIGGGISVNAADVDGEANNPVDETESLTVKVLKPAEKLTTVIKPERAVSGSKTEVEHEGNIEITPEINSGINIIKAEVSEGNKIISEEAEIKIYINEQEQNYVEEGATEGEVEIEKDGENKIIIKTGSLIEADGQIKIEYEVEFIETSGIEVEFNMYVDNEELKSELETEEKQQISLGRLMSEGKAELYIESVNEETNTAAYGSEGIGVKITGWPEFTYEEGFGFTHLELELDELLSVGTEVEEPKLTIGEVEFKTITSGEPESDEIKVEITEKKIEMEFGKKIDMDYPSGKKVQLEVEVEAAEEEGESRVRLYGRNEEQEELRQEFEEGNTQIANNPTGEMRINIIKTPARELVGQIYPGHVKPGVKGEEFEISVYGEFGENNAGIKRFRAYVPQGFGNWNFVEDKIEINGEEYTKTTNPSPVGKRVYIEKEEQYFELTLGDKLEKKGEQQEYIVRINIEMNTPITQNAPVGQKFKIYAYPEEGAAMIVKEGEVEGNPSTIEGMRVITARTVNSAEGELKVVSSDGSFYGEEENLVMVNSIGNEVSYYIKLNYVEGNRGVNLIRIEVPESYTNIGFEELRVNGEYEEVAYSVQESNNLYIGIEEELMGEGHIRIDMTINAPGETDEGEEFKGYVDRHYNEDFSQPDGNELAEEVTEGNVTEEADSGSIKVYTVQTPALGVTGEIYPETVYINRQEEFELTVMPQITEYNSGVDIIRVEVPESLKEREIVEIEAKGVKLTEESDYTIEEEKNIYTINLAEKIKHTDSNKSVKIKFEGETGEEPVYVENKVEVYINDSENDRIQKVAEGSTGVATNPTGSLNVEIRAIATIARGELNPNYIHRGKEEKEFELIKEFEFNERDTGVNKIECEIPEVYDGNTKIEESKVSINGEELEVINLGFPADDEVLMEYRQEEREGETRGIIIQRYGRTIEEKSQIKTTFKLSAPEEIISDRLRVELINEENDIKQEVRGKTEGSYVISTEDARVDYEQVSTEVEPEGEGNWKIELTIPFTVRMNTFYPGLEVYLENRKAKIIKYSNRRYPTENDEEVGVIKAEVKVPYEEFRGGENNILTVKNIEDGRNNKLGDITETIGIGYGIAMSVFVNPVDRRSLRIVTRQTEPLREGHSIRYEVREFQGSPERTGVRKQSAGIYSGVYKIEKDGRPIITASIYDENENRLKLSSREYNTIMLSPAAEKEIELTEKIKMTVEKETVEKEELMLVKIREKEEEVKASYGPSEEEEKEKEQKKLYEKEEIEIKISQKLNRAIKLKEEKEDKKKLIYKRKEDGSLEYKTRIKEGYYRIKEAGVYVTARDEGEPEIASWEERGNIIYYEIEDRESRVEKTRISVNNMGYENIAPRGKIRLQEGINKIELEAEDAAGNKVSRTATVMGAASQSIERLSIYPNPAVDYVLFDIEGSSGAEYRIRIYDISGRAVKEERVMSISGETKHMWDLRDKRGSKVAGGTYVYEVEGDGKILKRGKLSIVR